MVCIFFLSAPYHTKHSLTLYNSNQENLRILEDMGVRPDMSYHERRPSLKSVAMAVRAAIKMRNMAEGWAANEKVHEALVRKAQQTRRMSKKVGAR